MTDYTTTMTDDGRNALELDDGTLVAAGDTIEATLDCSDVDVDADEMRVDFEVVEGKIYGGDLDGDNHTTALYLKRKGSKLGHLVVEPSGIAHEYRDNDAVLHGSQSGPFAGYHGLDDVEVLN